MTIDRPQSAFPFHFRDLSFAWKMGVLSAILLGALAAVSLVGYRALAELNTRVLQLQLAQLPAAAHASRMTLLNDELRNATRHAIAAAGAGSTTELEATREVMASTVAAMRKSLDGLERLAAWNEGAQIVGHVRTALDTALDSSDRVIAEAATAGSDGAIARFTAVKNPLDQLSRGIAALANAVSARIDGYVSDIKQRTEQKARWMAIVALAGLLGGALVSLLIIRLIVKPIRELGWALDAVAGGDLRQRLPVRSSDEIGRVADSLNFALDQTSELVDRIATTAGSLGGLSTSLLQLNHMLSDSAETTSNKANATAVALSQVTRAVQAVSSAIDSERSSAREAQGESTPIHLTTPGAMERIAVIAGQIEDLSARVASNEVDELAESARVASGTAGVSEIAAGELSTLANELNQLVARFRWKPRSATTPAHAHT